MKNFTNILFLFILITAAKISQAQPCMPDTAFPGTQGILPAELEKTIVNVPYTAIIQYKAPADTNATVAGAVVKVTVDSLRITEVIGLPANFTYACHNANCMILGGKVGCAKITGTATPAQVGTYPLKVVVKLRGRFPLFGLPIQIPESLQYDTNTRYAIVIGYNTGLRTLQASSPMVLYPNPSNGHVQITLGSAIKEEGIIEVRDLSGRSVYRAKMEYFDKVLDLSHLPKGLYLLEVNAIQGNYRSRLRLD
jgi:hypothetical protein